jgi:hypothetical protein
MGGLVVQPALGAKGKATTPSVSERGEESFPLLSVKRETEVDKEVDKEVDRG